MAHFLNNWSLRENRGSSTKPYFIVVRTAPLAYRWSPNQSDSSAAQN